MKAQKRQKKTHYIFYIFKSFIDHPKIIFSFQAKIFFLGNCMQQMLRATQRAVIQMHILAIT